MGGIIERHKELRRRRKRKQKMKVLKRKAGKATPTEKGVIANKIRNMEDAGKISAIGRAQAVIEFNLDGTILTANENFLAAVGYRLEEIQGKHHRIFVAPAERDGAAYKEFWAKLGRGELQSGEY